MTIRNGNRRPGVASRSGGKDYQSSDGANVVTFPSKGNHSADFDRLTAELILAQHRAGKLPEAVLIGLLAAVGVQQ